jgi:carbon starvation protein
MARVFSGLPGMSTLLAYWYHFAIMFEALFILTTIDTGTRIGRFLVQEFVGRWNEELGKSTSKVGGVLATFAVVAGWEYFILTGSISTIWPMFGIANQLLACTALCVATTIILREAKRRSTPSSPSSRSRSSARRRSPPASRASVASSSRSPRPRRRARSAG